jgi:hypothetical protein
MSCVANFNHGFKALAEISELRDPRQKESASRPRNHSGCLTIETATVRKSTKLGGNSKT